MQVADIYFIYFGKSTFSFNMRKIRFAFFLTCVTYTKLARLWIDATGCITAQKLLISIYKGFSLSGITKKYGSLVFYTE